MSASHHHPQNWLLLLLLTLIWGSSYILIKKGLIAFTPLELASLRISISGLCSIPFLLYGWRKLPHHNTGIILQVGILGSGVPAFLFALSMTHSGSAMNGILNSITPIWTLLIGYYLYRIPFTRLKALGIFSGFTGAVVLVLGKNMGLPASAATGVLPNRIDLLYSLFPVLATFCYGMSSNLTKQRLQADNPLYTTSMAMAWMGLPALLIFACSDAPAKVWSGQAWASFVSVFILAFFGTFIAWILFYRLIQRTDAVFAASVTYLIPIVAVGWGVTDGEVLSLFQLLGMALILAGVALVSRK